MTLWIISEVPPSPEVTLDSEVSGHLLKHWGTIPIFFFPSVAECGDWELGGSHVSQLRLVGSLPQKGPAYAPVCARRGWGWADVTASCVCICCLVLPCSILLSLASWQGCWPAPLPVNSEGDARELKNNWQTLPLQTDIVFWYCITF